MHADPAAATAARQALHSWLRRQFPALDQTRLNDLTLAGNEAIANVVDHAYDETASAPTMDLDANYLAGPDVLTVTVADRGRWRQHEPDPLSLRGRGIPLIRALADTTDITSTPAGTTVTMQWNGLRGP